MTFLDAFVFYAWMMYAGFTCGLLISILVHWLKWD